MILASLVANRGILEAVEVSKIDYGLWVGMVAWNTLVLLYAVPCSIVNWRVVLQGKTYVEEL